MEDKVITLIDSYIKPLHHIIKALELRINTQRENSVRLDAWQSAFRFNTTPSNALFVAFDGFINITTNDLISRRLVEASCERHLLHTKQYFHSLDNLVDQARKQAAQLNHYEAAVEAARRDAAVQYDSWKAQKHESSTVSSRLIPGGRPRVRPRNSDLAGLYDTADATLRKCVGKLNVARVSFKEKLLGDIEPLQIAYQDVVRSLAETLQHFSEHEGAGTVILAASSVLSSSIATAFQQQVKACVQETQIEYARYSSLEFQQEDLELNIPSHKIIFGFPLPRPYFSRTPDVDVVVNVFKALVNRVSSAGAWDYYATRGQEVVLYREDRVRMIHDIECKWTGLGEGDRHVLESFSPPACASLVKHLLSTFPRPLLEIDPTLAQTLLQFSSGNADSNASSGNSAPIWTGSSPSRLPDDGINTLTALIKPLHRRAQGEILRALCDSLQGCYIGRDYARQAELTRTICNLLTRTVGHLDALFPSLVIGYGALVEQFEEPVSLQVPRSCTPSAVSVVSENDSESPTLSPNRFSAILSPIPRFGAFTPLVSRPRRLRSASPGDTQRLSIHSMAERAYTPSMPNSPTIGRRPASPSPSLYRRAVTSRLARPQSTAPAFPAS